MDAHEQHTYYVHVTSKCNKEIKTVLVQFICTHITKLMDYVNNNDLILDSVEGLISLL